MKTDKANKNFLYESLQVKEKEKEPFRVTGIKTELLGFKNTFETVFSQTT